MRVRKTKHGFKGTQLRSDRVTLLKRKCSIEQGKALVTLFPISTYIKQVFNELLTDKRHIKVPQDRLIVLHDQTSVASL